MEENIYDLIIIGAGPAGMSASVYASKANLKTLMIEKDFPGGKVVNTSFIENWPGYKRVEGYKLATEMFEHSTAYGTQFKQDRVLDIKSDGIIKEVVCEKQTFKTYAVIIATGTKERKIGIPGEDEFYGRGVSYCAVCDGSLYKDKDMVVIGGGNSALQESLYLTNFAKKIYLVHRRDQFRAEDQLVDAIKNHPKIELLLNFNPIRVNGDKYVTSVDIKSNKTDEEMTIETEVVFPFIGADPESRFTSRLDIIDQNGYLKINDLMETDIPGIYGAGDVNKKGLRQIVTAVNDGAIAAMNAYHYIKKIQKENKKS